MFDKIQNGFTKEFVGKDMYPAEYVIRIFKGKYPRLNLNKDMFCSQSICDVGCGQGRNMFFLADCGFKEVCGVEITKELVDYVNGKMSGRVLAKVGKNSSIPFPDSYFDFILSWNACYYMDDDLCFDKNVYELSRIAKPGANLVCSIPKKSCFIYKGSDPSDKQGYRIIRKDPFNLRNGSVLRMFEDENDITASFSEYFRDFVFASVEDDCFGFDYHWHLMVCTRK
jgi:SAM-dependent methyltransferase